VSGPGEPHALGGGRTSVDPHLLQEALGSVSSPVAVVTSYLDGRPHGSTVGAFCSLSWSPPLVLISLDVKCELVGMLRDAGSYAVNVLAGDQQELARTLARKGSAKFADVPWTLERGVPRILGTASWVVCRLEDLLPGGDHLIAIGHVVHAEATDAEPLLHRRRTFGTLASLPA
jgi:flavin reductase (DIM6/NTAB) family NADH-FMN oxidoreductase RutF